MKKLQIRLFGRFSVTYESQPLAGLESTKVQELLCYLLLRRDRPHPRTTLASVLWGDICTTSNSRKYLRNALWRLRAAVCAVPGLEDMIVADGEWVELRSRPALALDLAPFEHAYTVYQKKRVTGLAFSDAGDIDKAIRIYSGCLLANWNQEWCIAARDRLHQHYLTMLDKLAEYQEIQGDNVNVLALAERLLESDPAHERTHRRMMRVYLKSGDRTNALRQYARCVDALQNELGVDPGPKTLAVLDRICNGKAPVVHLLAPRVVSEDIRPRPTSAAS